MSSKKQNKVESIIIKQKKRNFLVEIVMKKGVVKHQDKKKQEKHKHLVFED
jgi:hypothetical protein